MAGKDKTRGRAGIERKNGVAGVCGNGVAEMLVQEKIVGLKAGLPFVAAVMDGNSGFNVSLFEIVAQEGGDGPSAIVGIQIGGVVTHHAVNIGEDVR